MKEIIEIVEWESVRVSPFQPRRHFSAEELEELAASIRAVGLIHPPVVRKITSGGKVLYYELIAGERRWRAAKKAGFEKLSVLVRDSDDEHAAKSTLIENVQRVNLDPIEMAEAFQKLISVFRMTQEEVAEKVGKKRSTVANYLRLLGLPQSIQEALSKGEISTGHAKAILALDSAELQGKLTKMIRQNQLTVRDAEKESRRLIPKKKKKESASARDSFIEEIEERLKEHFGTKVEIAPSRRGGKITLHYYSLDDFDRLSTLLSVKTEM
ncbi:MAG: ParB/RepB/Spo0J family partition protein [Chlamydiales bacterium]|nr:ParB/RepB/Spo0J family partition protein [Chlamydiales bacterium]